MTTTLWKTAPPPTGPAFNLPAPIKQVHAEIITPKIKAKSHPLVVGDILTSSWGYDQTNVDFYEVTKVTPKQAYLCKIGASRTDDLYLVPSPGKFIGEPSRHKVTVNGDGSVWVSLNSYSGASLWNGEPKGDTYAWGGAGH